MKKNFSIKANIQKRTFTIRINGNKYRTYQFNKEEFEQNLNNTEGDWKYFLSHEDYYYTIR